MGMIDLNNDMFLTDIIGYEQLQELSNS